MSNIVLLNGRSAQPAPKAKAILESGGFVDKFIELLELNGVRTKDPKMQLAVIEMTSATTDNLLDLKRFQDAVDAEA